MGLVVLGDVGVWGFRGCGVVGESGLAIEGFGVWGLRGLGFRV